MQGHVRKRRTWEFIVDIGAHPVTGRRRQKNKSGFARRERQRAPCASSSGTWMEAAIPAPSSSAWPTT